MATASIESLAKRVMDGQPLGVAEARVLAGVECGRLEEMLYWAGRIRTRHFGRRVGFCCIAPGRLGGCSEDCGWCGQAARLKEPHEPSERTAVDDLVQAARRAQQAEASCFCVVNPGRRPSPCDLEALEDLNAALTSEGLPPACASMGELDAAAARRLRSAGVIRYNHNLETSRSHFARVVSTHRYDDRLATLRAARREGLALCCGGIFGIGETWDDRIELALTLRDEVGPEVVPLNFHDARLGTPLADLPPLSPMECLHIIALFRFLLPRANLKIAGGRRLLGDLQSWVFRAGASSLMVGDYLTTCGRSLQEDRRMVADLGLELAPMHVGSEPVNGPIYCAGEATT